MSQGSDKPSLFVGVDTRTSISIIVLLFSIIGIAVSTTRSAVMVTSTLERIDRNQENLLIMNEEAHRLLGKRITANEFWIIRKEGYDKAISDISGGGVN